MLNAQQELVNARVSLVSAQRDRVVASYTLLSAVGRLVPDVLGLRVPTYRPQVHYEQVRDSWAGVRIPDGRLSRACATRVSVHSSLRFIAFLPATAAPVWRIKG